MILDIILGIILIVSMVLGFKNGTSNTMLHTVSWAIAVVCGVAFKKRSQAFLSDKTNTYQFLTDAVYKKAHEGTIDPIVNGHAIPDVLVRTGSHQSAASLAYMVVAFLFVIFMVRVATMLFYLLFAKKFRRGLNGFFDGFLGLLLGTARGAILVCVFLVILFPFLAITSPEFANIIMNGMSASFVAGDLYDHNFLLGLLTILKI